MKEKELGHFICQIPKHTISLQQKVITALAENALERM